MAASETVAAELFQNLQILHTNGSRYGIAKIRMCVMAVVPDDMKFLIIKVNLSVFRFNFAEAESFFKNKISDFDYCTVRICEV